MDTGIQADYYWLEDGELTLPQVLAICPELVLGKYLVVTAFDSGPPSLPADKAATGWLRHDEVALNPCVRSVEDLPFVGYDEWFIFSRTPLLEPFKVFVNNSIFTLRDPARDRPEAGQIRELQYLFWLQLELKRAETYVADGHIFILATHNQALFDKLIESLDANRMIG